MRKKIFAIVIIALFLGVIFIWERNDKQRVNESKIIEKSLSLINKNKELSCYNIDQKTIVFDDKENIDKDSFTWVVTYQKDIGFDTYIRIGNLKTEKADNDEYYVELLYNEELDKIIAYNILQANTNKNPYLTVKE